MTTTARAEIGAPAPDFTLPADGGRTVALSELRGRTVVLYLYPKDDTSGCTKEPIGFSERLPDFEAAGAVVLGLSKDPPASHDRFRDKHGLKVTLLSDETGETVAAYGAWVQKSMYGREYMGVDRATFLIDGDGVLRRAWRKVKVPGHVDEVLAAARDPARPPPVEARIAGSPRPDHIFAARAQILVARSGASPYQLQKDRSDEIFLRQRGKSPAVGAGEQRGSEDVGQDV